MDCYFWCRRESDSVMSKEYSDRERMGEYRVALSEMCIGGDTVSVVK